MVYFSDNFVILNFLMLIIWEITARHKIQNAAFSKKYSHYV